MTREYMDSLIEKLQDEILLLESMVRDSISEAVKSLMTQDKKLAKQVSKRDKEINVKRFEIENECLITIATQQPLASDLRMLASILEISTELERMGDYAKGICKVTKLTAKKPILAPMEHLPGMASEATDMLKMAVRAFVDGDVDAARAIPQRDDIVDDGFNAVYKGLVKEMIKDPDSIRHANHLQWAAHNIERMADRVTNICERTLFIETGSIYEIEEFDSIDFDEEEDDDDEIPIHNMN